MKRAKFYKTYDWAAYSLGGYADIKTAVFVFLYSFYENKRRCFPSLSEISNRLYHSRATVNRAIQELVKIGLIVKVKGNFRYSNEYKISEKKVAELQSEYKKFVKSETGIDFSDLEAGYDIEDDSDFDTGTTIEDYKRVVAEKPFLWGNNDSSTTDVKETAKAPNYEYTAEECERIAQACRNTSIKS